MAVHTVRTDDLTGDPDATSVVIVVNGTGVALDLAEKSVAKLTKLLEPYWAAGLVAEYDVDIRTRARPGARAATERGYDLAGLRRWAADAGIALPSRGRIPAEIVQKYLHR